MSPIGLWHKIVKAHFWQAIFLAVAFPRQAVTEQKVFTVGACYRSMTMKKRTSWPWICATRLIVRMSGRACSSMLFLVESEFREGRKYYLSTINSYAHFSQSMPVCTMSTREKVRGEDRYYLSTVGSCAQRVEAWQSRYVSNSAGVPVCTLP